ncbi:flagellar basal body-associated FliL family protein [Photobacterium nomapromontoriensis]|uniref:flagellar basal body-associated FliL family protein n=1 Tax=Photobacterium nomapromontoriensis TaxID=2910237 RepID=UPI003D0A371C
MTEEVQPKKKNTVVIVAIIVAVIAVLGSGGWWFWQQQQAAKVVAVAKTAAVPATALVKKPVFLPLNKFVVSVPGDQRLHYLMLEITLMSYDSAQIEMIEEFKPLVQNAVVSAVSQKNYDELTAKDAMSSLEVELRDDIRAVMNEMAGTNGIDKVLITKMVIQ